MLSSVACAIMLLVTATAASEPPPLTRAERSGYQATALHAEVVEFVDRLAAEHDVVRRGELGTTVEGRVMPLLILADPPVATAAEAKGSKKLVVFAFGNIHAGEVCGKEALLMLARDIAAEPGHPLLKDLVIVLAPIYNCDGNERVSKDNRRGQVGPANGMGQRRNAGDLDLNRDYVKLEAPETRAMVRLYNEWDPAVIIDTHTTNGSHHQYGITYAAPRNPAGDARMIEFVRDTMLPEVSRRLEAETGVRSFFYGNFNRDHTKWSTYPDRPRYGTPYRGLRNRIAILSEAYAYDSYRDRVLNTRDFVLSCFEYAAANEDEIRKLIRSVDSATTAAGRRPKKDDLVAIRSAPEAFEERIDVAGYVEAEIDGRRVSTGRLREYRVEHVGRFKPTLSVRRPYAYVLEDADATVVEKLQQHGIKVDVLREDIELDLEVYRVDGIERAQRAFQKHKLVTLEATARSVTRRVKAGATVVRTGQPLGTLAVYLLEPQSDDGLATWNYFDDALKPRGDFPVARLLAPVPLTLRSARPLAEDRTLDQPITYDTLYGGRGRPNFSGSAVSGFTWLDDGKRFLQSKDGRLRVVDADTGRSEPFYDPKDVADALADLPALDRGAARRMTRGTRPRMNPQRTAALFTHEKDLYHCGLDGAGAARLTRTPEREQFSQFSPDGRLVSFVRENDLCVVDVATQTDRALTADGSDQIHNGQATWVYGEELYGHRTPLHWWSPDSSRLAFLQLDDEPVHDFTVVNHTPTRLKVEATPYPKAGDPNPTVRLGIVPANGNGDVRWADLEAYKGGDYLITHVGWMPDSKSVYFYVQDRAQTWLDFNVVPRRGGKPKRLFREETEAWVNNPGDPKFLEDGSFLLRSDRTGWQHIYRFASSGKLMTPVTSGDWEVRTIHLVDESNGVLYCSGTRDNMLGSDLYRARLDGSGLERLTSGAGTHRVTVSPDGERFIDSWSDRATPTQVRLRRGDGTLVRMLDTNPVYDLEAYRFGEYKLVEIERDDGLTFPGSLRFPPDFDPGRKYPVWFMTYAGPHFPTLRDAWRDPAWDAMLAEMGIVVFRCDPYSASGRGAKSAWTAYRRLGVPELEDIERAIGWLSDKPWVDASRIGMSGHSYGGFMTSFAMTHCKLFSAGIAGAPVTDWRLYDSIYTERYMDTPQENPEGYDATSVVKAAKNLHGRLLILHGVIDNNVHMQNTMNFVRELQKAGKQFELMVYPESRHGIRSRHYRPMLYEFIRRTMLDSVDAPVMAADAGAASDAGASR